MPGTRENVLRKPKSGSKLPMTFSIGRLAKRFGLSRSTLLYYDRIGLLVPPGRSRAGYRIYADSDVQRLEAICRYRKAGLSLDAIRELLDNQAGRAAAILEARLDQLNTEIESLREQQRVIVSLLGDPRKLRASRTLDKDAWVALLRATGLDEEGMYRWHVEFERMAPEAHADFLASLGLPKREITRIRRASRPPGSTAARASMEKMVRHSGRH